MGVSPEIPLVILRYRRIILKIKNPKLKIPPHLPPTPRTASGLRDIFCPYPGLRSPLARFTPGYRLAPSGLKNSARIRSQVPTLWRHLPPQSRYGTAVISLFAARRTIS